MFRNKVFRDTASPLRGQTNKLQFRDHFAQGEKWQCATKQTVPLQFRDHLAQGENLCLYLFTTKSIASQGSGTNRTPLSSGTMSSP